MQYLCVGFPFVLGEGITIHKFQGRTIDKPIIFEASSLSGLNSVGAGLVYELEDVSLNVDSSLDMDSKNDITNLTSNPIKMRIYLNSLTQRVKTYCLKVWKA